MLAWLLVLALARADLSILEADLIDISPSNATAAGCSLKDGQPAVYEGLCASRSNEEDCENPLYGTACYWDSPAPPPPPSCTKEMQNICGRTSSKEACHACMVGHADTLMSAPATGTYYNCAGADLVKFCNDKPAATGGNSSGCLPKIGRAS